METTTTTLSPLDTAAQKYFQSNDKSDINEIINESVRLIRSLSRIYGGGCDSDDLLQAGRLGLMKAIRSFDPRKRKLILYICHTLYFRGNKAHGPQAALLLQSRLHCRAPVKSRGDGGGVY